MTVKKIFTYNKEDRSILVLCLVLLFVGFFLLKEDINLFGQGDSDSNRISIGKVARISSDVRQRGSKNLFWNNTKTNDAVYLGDSLFVGPSSKAEITFDDGRSIQIGENSLVKFSYSDKQIKLSLQYGNIKSDNLPKNVVLDDCGKAYKVSSDGADFKISKNTACGKVKVEVKKGVVVMNKKIFNQSANPEVASEKAEPIFKNSPLAPIVPEVVPEPVVEALPQQPEVQPAVPVAPEAPKLFALKRSYPIDSKQALVLNWTQSADAEKYIVEFSSDRSFAKSIKAERKDNIYIVKSHPFDHLYYRVKAVSKENLASEYSPIGEVEYEYPVIKTNKDKIAINYIAKSSRDRGQVKNVEIDWNDIPKADKYIVEVDQDPQFKNPKTFVTRTPASLIPVPGAGQYHYKVKAYDSKNRQISSTADAGEIIYNAIFNLVAPVLDQTASRMTYYFQKGLGKYVWLRWQNSDATLSKNPTTKYKVIVSQDEQFQNIFKAYETKNTKLLMTDSLPIGNYYWKVRTESVNQGQPQVSDWSNSGFLEVVSGKAQ